MRPLVILPLVTGMCVVFSSLFHAQEATWVHKGPGGGTITAVLEDPEDTALVYLTTRGQGFWKSEDGGMSWTRKENGLPLLNINNAAADPSGSGRIFAGTARGVYRSTDNGENWSIASGGEMDTTRSFLVTVDPIQTTTIYAVAIGNGAYRSTNAGSTWLTINLGLPPLTWVDIAVDPASNTTLYLSSSANGVFRSDNQGNSWNQKNEGLTNTNLRSFVLGSRFPFLIIHAGTTSGGFFTSSDFAENWQAAGSGLPAVNITALASIGTDEEQPTLAGTDGEGIFLSNDNGISFSAIAPPLADHIVRCFSEDPVERIFTGMENDGIFVSRDGGSTWLSSSRGLGGVAIAGLAVNRDVPLRIYAAPSAGENDLLSSSDSGTNWELRQEGLPSPTGLHDLWLAADPGTVFAATDSGVFMTTDSGLSWEPRNSGFVQTVLRIEGTPLDENLLFALSSGIMKSTDGGLSWSEAGEGIVGSPLCLHVAPNNPDTLYAGTKPAGPEGGGVFKSTDGGASWFSSNNGIPALESIFSLDIHSSSPHTIFAATSSGIFRSSNAGETWFLRNQGVPFDFAASDVLIDAADPARVFASSLDHGVYVSTNSGESWNGMNTGLDTLTVALLAQYEAAPDTLLAGTNGQGIYLIDLSPTGVQEDSPDEAPLPAGLALIGNYPNPFNPQTTIEFSIGGEDARAGEKRQVVLRVHDLRGRLVRTLFDGLLAEGTHRFTWDGRDAAGTSVASGSYFITVSSDGRSMTRKMSLIR